MKTTSQHEPTPHGMWFVNWTAPDTVGQVDGYLVGFLYGTHHAGM